MNKYEEISRRMDTLTPKQIADELNISVSNVWYWIKKIDPTPRANDEFNKMEKMQLIRRMFYQHETDKHIAVQLGISIKTVQWYRSEMGLNRRLHQREKLSVELDDLRYKALCMPWSNAV